MAGSIATGELAEERVDADVRHFISAESGANDGLALVLIMLPLLLLQSPLDAALAHWALVILLGEVFGSILAGVLVGFLVAKVLD